VPDGDPRELGCCRQGQVQSGPRIRADPPPIVSRRVECVEAVSSKLRMVISVFQVGQSSRPVIFCDRNQVVTTQKARERTSRTRHEHRKRRQGRRRTPWRRTGPSSAMRSRRSITRSLATGLRPPGQRCGRRDRPRLTAPDTADRIARVQSIVFDKAAARSQRASLVMGRLRRSTGKGEGLSPRPVETAGPVDPDTCFSGPI